MQKLSAELAALTARRTLLEGKQSAAQIALDDAIEARQTFMLAGNLDDETISKKRQGAVDAAVGMLAGFEKPLAALAVSIADGEGRMAAEQLAVDRRVGSEKLTAQTDAIESQLGPWLALTRELAASTAAVGPVHYEVDQIGRYLRNAASEVETAIKLSVGNLRVSVTGILDGHRPIPAEPAVIVPVAEPIGPVLVQLFTLNALQWTDPKGVLRRIGKWNDVELPEAAAACALRHGKAAPMNDPRRKTLKNSGGGGHPEAHWCFDCDREPDADDATTAITIHAG